MRRPVTTILPHNNGKTLMDEVSSLSGVDEKSFKKRHYSEASGIIQKTVLIKRPWQLLIILVVLLLLSSLCFTLLKTSLPLARLGNSHNIDRSPTQSYPNLNSTIARVLYPLSKVKFRNEEFFMSTYPNDFMYNKHYSKGKFYETSLTEALLRYQNRYGGNILDVGMNIGSVTVPMAHFCRTPCQVISIEAMSTTFAKARANVEMNNLSNVRMLNVALQDQPNVTSLLFLEYEGNRGGDSVLRTSSSNDPHDSESGSGGVRVDATTIDQLPKDLLHNVTVAKFDIEGSEMKAILGGLKWLGSKSPPCVIAMEVTAFKPEEMNQLLSNYGYSGRSAQQEGIRTGTPNLIYFHKNC